MLGHGVAAVHEVVGHDLEILSYMAGMKWLDRIKLTLIKSTDFQILGPFVFVYAIISPVLC